MTTRRRYNFQWPGAGNHAAVLRVLQRACDAWWWYEDPEVSGEDYSVLSVTFTVSARDQWFAHRRAMKLATQALCAAGIAESKVPTPVWEPLEPHTNRGRHRVPR